MNQVRRRLLKFSKRSVSHEVHSSLEARCRGATCGYLEYVLPSREVTAAADAIDVALRNDPILRGETYTRTTRVLQEWPLIVTYRVYDGDRLVRVLSVDELSLPENTD